MNCDRAAINRCSHSSHLFAHPLCPNQKISQRVGIIAFHALTGMSCLLAYHLLSSCFVPCFAKKRKPAPFDFPLGQEALRFAKEKLDEHPDISPFISQKFPPVNPEISLLITLLNDVYFQALKVALNQGGENPWNRPEVISAADDLLKIAYVINVLTLEDLEPFTQARRAEGLKVTYREVYIWQRSYHGYAGFCFAKFYTIIRSGRTNFQNVFDSSDSTLGILSCQTYDRAVHETPSDHEKTFYEDGTTQSGWREMYNKFCSDMLDYFSSKDLRKCHSFVPKIHKDTEISEFEWMKRRNYYP